MLSYAVFWFLYKYQDYPKEFSDIERSKLEQIANRFIEKIGLCFSVKVQRELEYMFAICILRFRKKHKVKFAEKWQAYLPYDLNKNIIEAVREGVENFYIYEKVLMMTLSCFFQPFLYELKKMKSIIINGNLKNDSDVYKSTVLFMEAFNKKIIYIPSEKYSEIFVNVFKIHLIARVFKCTSFDYYAYSFCESISKQFSTITKKLELLIETLHQESDSAIFMEKDFLTQQYLIVFIDLAPLTYFEREVKIAVETNLP